MICHKIYIYDVTKIAPPPFILVRNNERSTLVGLVESFGMCDKIPYIRSDATNVLKKDVLILIQI